MAFKKGVAPLQHREGCICFRCNPLKGKRHSRLGAKLTKAHKLALSRAHKGNQVNKGRVMTEEHKRKISEAMKRRPISVLRRCMRRREKSSLELKVEAIIKKHQLPYRFVGNGAFYIERKNPDFINVNGEKKAVEVYYRRHKQNLLGVTVEDWQRERSKVFAEYGWTIIYIDEVAANEATVVELLKH